MTSHLQRQIIEEVMSRNLRMVIDHDEEEEPIDASVDWPEITAWQDHKDEDSIEDSIDDNNDKSEKQNTLDG
jgi:hypothetical protein